MFLKMYHERIDMFNKPMALSVGVRPSNLFRKERHRGSRLGLYRQFIVYSSRLACTPSVLSHNVRLGHECTVAEYLHWTNNTSSVKQLFSKIYETKIINSVTMTALLQNNRKILFATGTIHFVNWVVSFRWDVWLKSVFWYILLSFFGKHLVTQDLNRLLNDNYFNDKSRCVRLEDRIHDLWLCSCKQTWDLRDTGHCECLPNFC